MNGLTVIELAKNLGISADAVRKRLKTAGIQPKEYAGPTAIYPTSALAAIRDSPGPGRPPKAKK